MGKVRKGNYLFVDWIGDHGHHVHVYKDEKQVLKWDLDEGKAIQGKITKRILKLIRILKKEGRL
ncbi:MAG TPA: hypothetical protein DDW49_00135 [Deltaproteobacteria bacterium]|nr:MAG: hypothetical protein A2048_01120 [Deltaproteobacteria bacterium GWA2_45_12]HBF11796.1 hypothetical protein [Deltaproteobacteria bacterium]